MRKLFGALLLLSIAALVGCENISAPGGRVSTPSDQTAVPADTGPETFAIGVPGQNLIIKRGEKADAMVTIKRGTAFNDDVTVKVEAPSGLVVSPAEFTFKKGTDTQMVNVSVAVDAAQRTHEVKATAMPEKGESTSTQFVVEVRKPE